MKIGLVHYLYKNDSLKYFWGSSFDRALGDRHEIFRLPGEFYNAPKSKRCEIIRELCEKCDVLMGELHNEVLEYRETMDKPIPFVGNLSGLMSRGGGYIWDLVRSQYLKSTDIIVGNCTADIGITRKFFRNAEMRILPFSYDEATYFPIDESEKERIRAKMGFKNSDKILLYSGRLALEKNVHTVLGIFSVLQGLIPNLHLVIAGVARDIPFYELGVFTMGIGDVLQRLSKKLEIDEKRLHFIGRVDGPELRGIYNIADALINLTLFHDENFGLAQVESMACGAPVVGTKWGGLKDTIVDGETGFHVSTFATPTGVKVNWWEAVDNLCYLLTNEFKDDRFRQRARDHAVQNYSADIFRKNVESLFADCIEIGQKASIPIELTPLAQEFQNTCLYRTGDCPPYRRGPRAFELYREMIEPFTGNTDRAFGEPGRLRPESILCLTAPFRLSVEGQLLVNDPIFPLEVNIPSDHLDTIVSALVGFEKEPAMLAERLTKHYLEEAADADYAIAWLLDSGLILATNPGRSKVIPATINTLMGAPLLKIERIDYKTDVLAIR
jgi:glycosyltransferase involved in cell wall biosynthesis